jgi:hypothetical protein
MKLIENIILKKKIKEMELNTIFLIRKEERLQGKPKKPNANENEDGKRKEKKGEGMWRGRKKKKTKQKSNVCGV